MYLQKRFIKSHRCDYMHKRVNSPLIYWLYYTFSHGSVLDGWWLIGLTLLHYCVCSHCGMVGNHPPLWVCASSTLGHLPWDLGWQNSDSGVWDGRRLGSISLKSVLSCSGKVVGISGPGVFPHQIWVGVTVTQGWDNRGVACCLCGPRLLDCPPLISCSV